MLEGKAEGFYGEDDVMFGEDVVKHFQKGDHWPQSVDQQRISRNPDPKAARRFLVFTVTQSGAAGAARP